MNPTPHLRIASYWLTFNNHLILQYTIFFRNIFYLNNYLLKFLSNIWRRFNQLLFYGVLQSPFPIIPETKNFIWQISLRRFNRVFTVGKISLTWIKISSENKGDATTATLNFFLAPFLFTLNIPLLLHFLKRTLQKLIKIFILKYNFLF